MRKTLLVAAGFVALRENGDNDGREYYYDGKDDNFFINLGVGIHYFMEPASFASGEFFDWMVNAGINGRLLLTIYKITKELRGHYEKQKAFDNYCCDHYDCRSCFGTIVRVF